MLLALSRSLARALRAVAAVLERDASAGPRVADPLEETLAQLRQRYPDAPEHWLRFVAERPSAGRDTADQEPRLTDRGDREAPRAAAAPSLGAGVTDAPDAAAASRGPRVFSSAGDASRAQPADSSEAQPSGDSSRAQQSADSSRPQRSGESSRMQPATDVIRPSSATKGGPGASPSFTFERASRVRHGLSAGFPLPRPRFHSPPHVVPAGPLPQHCARSPHGSPSKVQFAPIVRVSNSSGEDGVARPSAAARRKPVEPAVERVHSPGEPPRRVGLSSVPAASAARASFAGLTRAIPGAHGDAADAADAKTADAMTGRVASATPRGSSRSSARFQRAAGRRDVTEDARHAAFVPAEPQWPELPATLGAEAAESIPAGRLPRPPRPPEESERWNALPF